MCQFRIPFIVVVSFLFVFQVNAQDDWSRWRGPTGNGIAANQTPPTEWSSTENVIWKVAVPGRGHASPIILGDKIFLATADKEQQTQSVLCYSRGAGEQLWQTVVNTGGLPTKIHPKNTHASSTVATDGERIFAVFNHDGIVDVTALDLDGKEVWKEKVGSYNAKYPFGFGASPIVHNGMVIVANEGRVDAAVVAFDAKTGKQKYKIKRGDMSSYSTPVIAKVGGKEQMFQSGGETVSAYNAETGEQNWTSPAQWQVSCGTMVWDKNLVFTSGGFPAQQTIALNAKTGKIVWQKPVKVYEQSLLAHDGYVWGHSDKGVIYCWKSDTGQEMWKEKFSKRKKPVSVSPTLVGEHIHFTAEDGETIVVKRNPKKFELVARNQLGTSAFATPAFCGDRIYTRVGDGDQEWLFCIGKN